MISVSSLPSAVSWLIAIVLGNVASLAVMFAARWWSERSSIDRSANPVGVWAGAMGSLCALLFAFAIATLWTGRYATINSLNAEAGAVRLAARDVPPQQHALLREYVEATIANWNNMCGGGASERSNAALVRLERDVTPGTSEQRNDFARQLSALESARGQRLQVARDSIPIEIWVALLMIGAAFVIVLALVNPQNLALHAVTMIAVGTSIGTLLWVLTLLDYPFCGSTGLEPNALLSALQFLNLEQ